MAMIWDCTNRSSTIKVGPAAPANPLQGDLWVNTSVSPNTLNLFNGTAWIATSTGGGGGAGLPQATREGQVLVAGSSPLFNWAAGDIDCGRF